MRIKTIALGLILGTTMTPHASYARSVDECSAKVLEICTKCHYQTRICERLDERSRDEWKSTIKRMLRYGLVLNESDREVILDCLMVLKKDRASFCKE